MPIEFRCNQCGKLLRTGDDTAGKQAKCPVCDTMLPIPVPTASPVPAPGAFPSLPSAMPSNPFAGQPTAIGSPFGAAPPTPFAPASDNPYQSPSAYVPPMPGWGGAGFELAGRGARFAGVMLDGLIQLAALVPAGVVLGVSGAFDDNAPVAATHVVGFLLLIASALAINIVQWVLITKSGQSLGKKALGTRIVRIEDGHLPGFVKGVILRSWVPGFLGALPCGLGAIFSLVNACWIFGEERRCLHDLIANTRVVVAR